MADHAGCGPHSPRGRDETAGVALGAPAGAVPPRWLKPTTDAGRSGVIMSFVFFIRFPEGTRGGTQEGTAAKTTERQVREGEGGQRETNEGAAMGPGGKRNTLVQLDLNPPFRMQYAHATAALWTAVEPCD